MKKFWLRLGVSVVVLTLLFVLLPWEEVRSAVTRMPRNVWLTVLVLFLAGHALGTLKWRLLVNAGRSGLKLMDAFRCYAAGLFANMCLPSIIGGDVLRAVLAGKATGRPEAVVLGSVSDRLIDLTSAGVLVVAGGLLVRGALPGWQMQLLTAAVVLGLAVTIIFLPLALRRPLKKWPRKLRRTVGRALVAMRRMLRVPSAAATALVISLIVQGGFVLLNAWIGRSIGIDAPIGAWMLAWSLAKLVGLLPISLGGLGVRDATLGALLTPFGVPVALGVVASLVWQSVLIVGGLIAGIVWRALTRTARAAAPSQVANLPLSTV